MGYKPEDQIPWYDKLLQEDEVNEIAEIVKAQLKKQCISPIVFFGEDPKQNPTWGLYYSVIQMPLLRLGYL